MDVGEAKLGIIAVASYDNEWRTRTGKQQDGIFVGDSVEFNSNYDFATTRNNVRSNGMLGLGGNMAGIPSAGPRSTCTTP